jgi:hypothetical protein|tara:strand:+ start:360 stop:521 length:162 start_codon:yes stop_codon:yes gene_type:complete
MTQFSVSYSYRGNDGEHRQSQRTVTASNSFHAIQRFKSIFDGPYVIAFKVEPV